MLRLRKKTKTYLTPCQSVTDMVLESNFCQTVRFNAQVDELHNINKDVEDDLSDESLYFEF